MKNKIIAVDFDGTLCVNKYPDIGEPRTDVIERLLQEQREGAHTILWTCRRGEELVAAVYWCAERGIVFEAINENLNYIVDRYGSESRKIHADEYWDDKAVLPFESEKTAVALAKSILNVIDAEIALNSSTAEQCGPYHIDGVIAKVKATEAETLLGLIQKQIYRRGLLASICDEN